MKVRAFGMDTGRGSISESIDSDSEFIHSIIKEEDYQIWNWRNIEYYSDSGDCFDSIHKVYYKGVIHETVWGGQYTELEPYQYHLDPVSLRHWHGELKKEILEWIDMAFNLPTLNRSDFHTFLCAVAKYRQEL